MKNENNAPAAAPDALQDFTSCPEWGTGGQFIYDPVTQIRTRVGEAPAPAGALHSTFQPLPEAAGMTVTKMDEAAATEYSDPGAPGAPAAGETVAPPKKERTRA